MTSTAKGLIQYSRAHGGRVWHIRRSSGSAVVGVNHIEKEALCGFTAEYWAKTETDHVVYRRLAARFQCAPCKIRAQKEGLL